MTNKQLAILLSARLEQLTSAHNDLYDFMSEHYEVEQKSIIGTYKTIPQLEPIKAVLSSIESDIGSLKEDS